MALYRALKHAYLTLVPERLRMMSHDKRTPLYYLLKPMRNTLYQFSDHDDVYDEHYYQDNIEPYIQQSASIMAESITRTFHPSFVVDVGCGTGELLRVLKEHNVAVQGFERSEAALKIARGKGVEVKPLDLEQPLDRLEIRRADLVISTEVAEHLPKSFADIFVDYLCRTADSVLMTAATPGQDGTDHVNEQPHEYWIEKFRDRGFSYDTATTSQLRLAWEQANVASFYHANLMIFRKSAGAGP
jgi:SAM-dependent methyltransferase